MNNSKSDKTLAPEEASALGRAIRQACDSRLGVLDADFMCKSIGTLPSRPLLTAPSTCAVADIIARLRESRAGCVVLTDAAGRVAGIFSERDLVLKVTEDYSTRLMHPISQYMTVNPTTVNPETTVAFALNLMSQGGFRHLPIVDATEHPIALLSVRDVIDAIVAKFMDDVMAV